MFSSLYIVVIATILAITSSVISSHSIKKENHNIFENLRHQNNNNDNNNNQGKFDLIYYTTWSTTYLHYNPNNQGWNGVPGTKMQQINSSYCTLTVWANSAVFVTTNGAGGWDNNHGRNYNANHAGKYLLKQGQLTLLESYPDGCPQNCNGHGTCDTKTGSCTCTPDYYGPTCNSTCHCPGTHVACNKKSGECQCQTGWSHCSGDVGCSTNTATDVNNCGTCGHVCNGKSAHVASISCNNSKCVATCETGYIACDDGTCAKQCPLPGCQTYNIDNCAGKQVYPDPKLGANRWQTPKRDSPNWIPSYQDYSEMVGYVDYMYAPDHQSVTLTVKSTTRVPTVTVQCSFGSSTNFGSCSSGFMVKSPTKGPMSVYMKGSDGSQVQLEDVDFLWDHPTVTPQNSGGDYRGGQKGAIVEMFQWPVEDIAEECAFLAKAGFLGIKMFPPTEQPMSVEPYSSACNPWYFNYQRVSWRFAGRHGSRDQLRRTINKCRALGVRVYSDTVANHNVGNGNDANPYHRNDAGGNCVYWGKKNTSADFPPTGKNVNGSSPFFTQGYNYQPNENTHLPNMQEFPADATGPLDYHCSRVMNSWNDPFDLENGWLVGLVDQATQLDRVRERIATFLVDMLSLGFSGTRLDDAKGVAPADWAAIFGKMKKKLGGNIPADFTVYMEVLTGGECSLLLGNPTSDYSYSVGFEKLLQSEGLTADDILGIKIWACFFPVQVHSCDNNLVDPRRLAIQNDDADEQNTGSTSRDLEGYGTVLVIDKDIDKHRYFEKKLFLNPRHVADNDNHYPIRLVLSSYWLPPTVNGYGVPDGNSLCSKCTVNQHTCDTGTEVPYRKAHLAGVGGYTNFSVRGEFTRVHRDNEIINAMRSWMHLSPINMAQYPEL